MKALVRRIAVIAVILLCVSAAHAHENAHLKSAQIEFKTGGKGKKSDTRLIIQVYCRDGSIAAKNDPVQTYGGFRHFTHDGPIDLAVDAAKQKDDIKGGYHVIRIEPAADDIWTFSYTLTLDFDDGTQLVYARNHRKASRADPAVRGQNL